MDHPEFKISYGGSLVFSDDFGKLCTCCPPRNDVRSEPSSCFFFDVEVLLEAKRFLHGGPTLVNSFEHVASSCGLTLQWGYVWGWWWWWRPLCHRLKRQVLQLSLIAQINQRQMYSRGRNPPTPLCGFSRSHGDCLPPKVCCRSCRWRRESWCSGRHRNEGQSRGSGSPPLGPCCRRAGESGRSLAWRTCSEKHKEMKAMRTGSNYKYYGEKDLDPWQVIHRSPEISKF